MRILVTGAAGQLGGVIVKEFQRDHEVVPLGHRELDITNYSAVQTAVAEACPAVIVNCAAYNDVDGAEDDAVTALHVNALAVRSLADAADAVGATLVHYSSDFVFDGEASAPYGEDDRPGPRSFYAASKLLGEWFAVHAPSHYVLRVESLFGGQGPQGLPKGSLERIVDAISQGQPVRVFVDRIVSPSYVRDVAAATRALVEQNAPYGLYHCVNSGHASWYDVAAEAARKLGVTVDLVPVSLAHVRLRAARPRFCALSNAKLASIGIGLPSWQDALGRFLALSISERRPDKTGNHLADGE